MVAKKVVELARKNAKQAQSSGSKARALKSAETDAPHQGQASISSRRSETSPRKPVSGSGARARRLPSDGKSSRAGDSRPLAAKGSDHTAEHSLDVGDPLPRASLLDQDGKRRELSEFRGKRLVLYFYPKDDTPGCTREACSFQENLASFKKAKAQVVGISADSPERHRRFADKYQLAFPLLVDADRTFATACGVIGEKVLYGKRTIGLIRSTFIVDEDGIVRRIFRNVKVDGHTEQVKSALAELEARS